MTEFSDFVVYVDESGDHNLETQEDEYDMFVLSFCIFSKPLYTEQIVPAFQRLKFQHFGHDMVVFHEREIRKATGSFRFLTDKGRRDSFLADLGNWVEESDFTIIAIAIRKSEYRARYRSPGNPYHFSMQMGLERVHKCLQRRGQSRGITHVVFESRGKREDEALELEFRRVCDGMNYTGRPFPFEIVFPGKQINSTGLQLADLTARPIGRHVLNPSQANRAFQSISAKLDRSPSGKVEGYGLKCFP
jgi:hypothetical protein